MMKKIALLSAGYLAYNIIIQKKDLQNLQESLAMIPESSGSLGSLLVVNLPSIKIPPPVSEVEVLKKIQNYLPEYKLVLNRSNLSFYWQVTFRPIKISFGPFETSYQPKSYDLPLVTYFKLKDAVQAIRDKIKIEKQADGGYLIIFTPLEIEI